MATQETDNWFEHGHRLHQPLWRVVLATTKHDPDDESIVVDTTYVEVGFRPSEEGALALAERQPMTGRQHLRIEPGYFVECAFVEGGDRWLDCEWVESSMHQPVHMTCDHEIAS